MHTWFLKTKLSIIQTTHLSSLLSLLLRSLRTFISKLLYLVKRSLFLIIFKANTSKDSLSSTKYTSPNDPFPIYHFIRYCSMYSPSFTQRASSSVSNPLFLDLFSILILKVGRLSSLSSPYSEDLSVARLV
jgi:hypothetical protein